MNIFKEKEEEGDLPYNVIWLSLDGRLRTCNYRTYKEAIERYNYLKNLKRQQSIHLNLHPDWQKPEEIK